MNATHTPACNGDVPGLAYGMGRPGAGCTCTNLNECENVTLLAGNCSATERCLDATPTAGDAGSPWSNRYNCESCLGGNATRRGDTVNTGSGKCVCEAEYIDESDAAATPPSPVPGEAWYDGGLHGSCTEGCAARSLVCTEEQLARHNHEIDSCEEIV